MLGSQGLPGFLAYGVYLGEVVGPVLVIIGLYTRIGAFLVIGNMLVALALAHSQELFSLGSMGAGRSSYRVCSFSARWRLHCSALESSASAA